MVVARSIFQRLAAPVVLAEGVSPFPEDDAGLAPLAAPFEKFGRALEALGRCVELTRRDLPDPSDRRALYVTARRGAGRPRGSSSRVPECSASGGFPRDRLLKP
jgi:hypothetical protein